MPCTFMQRKKHPSLPILKNGTPEGRGRFSVRLNVSKRKTMRRRHGRSRRKNVAKTQKNMNGGLYALIHGMKNT